VPLLPADLTSFVGRRSDIIAVRTLFSATRLVTLTGPGGAGKTRLALRVAGEMRRAFPDGVHLVELASVRDADLLPQTVIDALAIREQPALPRMTVLCEYLQNRKALLVLDNCERVVDATAELVDQMLRAAPDLRILVTSRQALRVTGEHLYPVPPLLAPDPNDAHPLGTITHYPSVALFVDRAAAVVPDFAVTPENERAIIRVCHRLEGLPLAIELAAARLNVLTVAELAARLDDRFQLLRAGSRNLPARHQTLKATMDWSYDLCTPTEQRLWVRASVFATDFSTVAAEGICSDAALPAREVFDAVSGLVEKSILTREEHGELVRFRMLESVRDYGRDRLEDDEAEALGRRHRDWYAELLERAEREWAGPDQFRWSMTLRLEHANLRRALEFSMSHPDEEHIALRMVSKPWFWSSHNHISEALLWLDRGLTRDTGASHDRAWALATTAYMAAFQGDPETLASYAHRARELAIELNDLPALAYANHVRGFRQSLGQTGDVALALPMLEDALDQYLQCDLPAQYIDSLLLELASVHILVHDLVRGSEVTERLYERCASAHEQLNFSYALWLRGWLALERGDAAEAEPFLLDSVRIKRNFQETLGLGLALEVTTWAIAASGDAERGAIMFGGTDGVWRALGARLFERKRLRYEAATRAALGDQRFEAAYARGAALTIDQTLAFALRDAPGPSAEGDVVGLKTLTKREREVAQLVARGLSNKEIAAKLVISLRTAEGHVDKILTKQGFSSRAQVAAWLAGGDQAS
jgi:non-specific serine/threonine protein kinase